MPTSGTNLIILGTDNKGLFHIRIFDAGSHRVTDTDETKLPDTQASAIAALKQQVLSLLPSHILDGDEKAKLLSEVKSIVNHTIPDATPPNRTPLICSDFDVANPFGYFLTASDINGANYNDVLASSISRADATSPGSHDSMIIEFDATNRSDLDVRITDLLIEVKSHATLTTLALESHRGGGRSWKYVCVISNKVGYYSCQRLDKAVDFVKLGKGELERFAIRVATPFKGVYKLSVWIDYSTGGEHFRTKVGDIPDAIGFIDKPSD